MPAVLLGMNTPLVLDVSEAAYIAVVVYALVLVPKLKAQHRWIAAALAVSVLFNTVQLTHVNNHWVSVVWPRFQGGLILAALSQKKYRVLLMVAPPTLTTWLFVRLNGVTPFAEMMVEVSVFAAIAVLAGRQSNPYLRWALLIYSLPTVVLSPALANLASQQAWDAWIPLFELVHVGRTMGLVLVGAWLWRGTRPEQLELRLRYR